MTCPSPFLEAKDIADDLYSIASTNETADNIPGPGRILGNLYRLLGQKLEEGLGSLAGKFGHGPRATALEFKHIHNNEALSVAIREKKLRKKWNQLESYAK